MRKLILVLGIACTVSGCSLTPVQPWQKGTLARPEMTIQGNDPLDNKFSDHLYGTREAASGGAGIGGGGCGCN